MAWEVSAGRCCECRFSFNLSLLNSLNYRTVIFFRGFETAPSFLGS